MFGFDFSDFDISKIEEIQKKVGEGLKWLGEFLPKIKKMENTWRVQHDLLSSDIFMYSATASDEKVFIYIFAVRNDPSTDKPVLYKQINRFDVVELAKLFEKDGMKVIMDLMMDFSGM